MSVDRGSTQDRADNARLRIALISAKGPLYRFRGGVFRRSLRYAPLTLTTLASLVPLEIDADIILIDEGVGELDLDLGVDLAAMTVITGTAPRSYELAAQFRRRRVPVVLGGPHVTLVPDEALQHADAIVVGYAEQTWPQLLRDFLAGRMRRRYEQATEVSLAGLPFPRRDLLPRMRYTTTNTFEATRGCIHRCDFCVLPSVTSQALLQKPVDDVIADIRQHGARKLVFVDVNLISDRAYARELFEALVPLRVQWYGLTTVLLTEDAHLLELAARSGCRGLLMGLESTSVESLRGASKGFNNPAEFYELTRALHAHRISLQGCFAFGFDHDTPDVFLETAQLAVDAQIDLPRFAVLTPFPNTPLYRRLEDEGRLLTKNWELFDGQHVVFQPAKMSVEQLQKGTEQAWRYAYRFRSILRRLACSAAPLWVRLATNLGYRYYAYNLRRSRSRIRGADDRQEGGTPGMGSAIQEAVRA
ncbi:MAG: B12-binding domain-containing radical SAM protein [Phycisphaerales bacterium]|nr:MAG: B12-binding domain-containing radical SAM protein [Phycisphaerales bacterium]